MIIVKERGHAAIVEYIQDGLIQRVILPREHAQDRDKIPLGIPYGEPWERIIKLSVTPEMVANELRKRGIWTYEDLMNSPQKVVAALQAAYGVDMSNLLRLAREWRLHND